MTRKDDESLTRAFKPWIRRTAIAAGVLTAYATLKHRNTVNRQVKAAVNGLQIFGDAALTRTLDNTHLKIVETTDPEEAEDAFFNFCVKGAKRFKINRAQLDFMIDPTKILIMDGYVSRSRVPGISVVMTNEIDASAIQTREYYAVRFTGRRFRQLS